MQTVSCFLKDCMIKYGEEGLSGWVIITRDIAVLNVELTLLVANNVRKFDSSFHQRRNVGMS